MFKSITLSVAIIFFSIISTYALQQPNTEIDNQQEKIGSSITIAADALKAIVATLGAYSCCKWLQEISYNKCLLTLAQASCEKFTTTLNLDPICEEVPHHLEALQHMHVCAAALSVCAFVAAGYYLKNLATSIDKV